MRSLTNDNHPRGNLNPRNRLDHQWAFPYEEASYNHECVICLLKEAGFVSEYMQKGKFITGHPTAGKFQLFSLKTFTN